jgi:ribose 5-phosphate isomerase B
VPHLGKRNQVKILLASDKAGFELKEKVKANLQGKGWEVDDVGLADAQGYMAYYTASDNLCRKIQAGEAKQGILICGTGAGMSINANKYEGIFAVACESIFSAKMCRVVNNANVLAMGGNIVGPGMAFDICDIFLNTGFTEGMPQDRADYLKNLSTEYQEFLAVKGK